MLPYELKSLILIQTTNMISSGLRRFFQDSTVSRGYKDPTSRCKAIKVISNEFLDMKRIFHIIEDNQNSHAAK
ncbi:hypothetical protein EUGRSUZ_E03325 [Eucalyptus grandis]|uniref:Uncharacterized protein n=2 Tax=Eucalyptus grandis TaxID=71139 RepID=A0ACC3KYV9_EUCGR|nr:hypothetical protein EUGRSUZ_E03325 [Eucalyptus grandis]